MKILIYSYNYHPEPIGIAPLMTELAEGLVKRGHQVRVVTAMPNYPERCIYKEYQGKLFSTTEHNGVMIQRSFVWVKPKPGLIDRVLLDASFIVTSLFHVFQGWRPDIILTTSPPLPICVPSVLLRWVYRAPIVLSLQDILPEAATQVGLLTNRPLIRIFKFLEHFSYRSADSIAVICRAFADNLLEKGVPAQKLNLIPNWVDATFICPLSKTESRFAQVYDLQNKFVVMYSGNIALTQGLQTAIAAADLLQNLSDIVFVIVGEQKALAGLQKLCMEKQLNNVLLLPFQPRAQLPDMLAAADIGLVLQTRKTVSFNMPSKIPLLLGSGRAIIASVPSTGTAAEAISLSQGGVVVSPENPVALADGIRLLYENPLQVKQLGYQGREFAVNTYAFDKILSLYETLFSETLASYQRGDRNLLQTEQTTGSSWVEVSSPAKKDTLSIRD